MHPKSAEQPLHLKTILLLARRCGVVAALVGWYAACYAGRRLVHRFRRSPGKAALRGELLAGLFEALGPTFIKIGQILSTRPDLLPFETIAALARLQDRVAPVPINQITAVFQDSFGGLPEECFAVFNPVPLSSASVAQVHRARLRDGTEVAVKIRRPNVVATVQGDLLLLRGLARVLQRFPGLRLVPFEGLVEEFGQAIEQQLDFRIEAANNRKFRVNFRVMPQVRFPHLVDDLCSEAVLTMEYVEGLTKVADLMLDVAARREAATIGLKALYKMIFIDGFIHGDMHPANMFFVPGPGVILLDVGLVARLEQQDLEDFVTFFLGLAENNGAACARIIWNGASYRSPGSDRTAFEEAMEALIDRHAALKAEDFEVVHFAADLFDTQRRHGVRGPTQFTMTIVALLVYEGIVKHMHPTLDFQKEARLFILRARHRANERRAQESRTMPPVSL
ncbi:MAG TPA: AarF/UbiB family protein [Rhodothermales bacterium]|nr:AarF/UbiB family protein [Rhodothermales bacterium]